MNRSSLKFLIVGLLVGALVSSAFDASALVSPQAPARGHAAKKAKKHKTSSKKKKKKKKKKKHHKKAPVPAPSTTAIPLVGLFRLTSGSYAGGKVSGSYIRLVLPGGSVQKGPYFPNPNSSGGTYTLLRPGTDGGLRTGAYQEPPNPPFAGLGNATANRIMVPQSFAFINYSLSTSKIDPQTKLTVPPPSIGVSDGKLSGSLQAVSAEWNSQFFNQGSPKPDGSSPGLTSAVTGTYNADTKAYTLDWTSQIVGGPFNHFSGVWHLEGVFEPSCGSV